MPLPVLHYSPKPSAEDLLRFYRRTEFHWSEHLAEPEATDLGTVFRNPRLPHIAAANRILEAVLLAGGTSAATVAEGERPFAEEGGRCLEWIANAPAGDADAAALADGLRAAGYVEAQVDVLRLDRAIYAAQQVEGVTVIPSRASYRHVREIWEAAGGGDLAREQAEAATLHLDDPHFESLLAMVDGRAVATAGVLAAGEVGRVEPPYVLPAYRGRGIGAMMLGRVLESSARSLFKHVLVGLDRGEARTKAVCEAAGFREVGVISVCRRPMN